MLLKDVHLDFYTLMHTTINIFHVFFYAVPTWNPNVDSISDDDDEIDDLARTQLEIKTKTSRR